MTTVDLSSPDGNAFVLMSIAAGTGRQLGWSAQEVSALLDTLRGSSNYAELLNSIEFALPDQFEFINDPRK